MLFGLAQEALSQAAPGHAGSHQNTPKMKLVFHLQEATKGSEVGLIPADTFWFTKITCLGMKILWYWFFVLSRLTQNIIILIEDVIFNGKCYVDLADRRGLYVLVKVKTQNFLAETLGFRWDEKESFLEDFVRCDFSGLEYLFRDVIRIIRYVMFDASIYKMDFPVLLSISDVPIGVRFAGAERVLHDQVTVLESSAAPGDREILAGQDPVHSDVVHDSSTRAVPALYFVPVWAETVALFEILRGSGPCEQKRDRIEDS